MTGKTHLAAGIATALLVTKPATPTDFAVCLGMSSLGALICDIDVKSSKSHKIMKRLISISLLLFVVSVFLEYYFTVQIISILPQNTMLFRSIAGISSFVAICSYGKEQPHRSFMHSLLALGSLSASIYIILPSATIYFFVAMLSHMILDSLNHKKVRFLYPKKRGLSFNLCQSNSRWNTWIFNGSLCIILLIGVEVVRVWIK